MQISAGFDSGNIEVVDASNPGDIQLQIRPDPPTTTPDGMVRFFQWFHFRVSGCREVELRIRIVNAGRSAYPDGWKDYRAVASTDRRTWFRVPTRFVDGELVIEHQPDADCVWYAYFAPYDLTRCADLIGRCAAAPGVRLRPVGSTLDGRPIDRLIVGGGRDKPVLWVIGRQHPGESMASWWMEGFLERLLDPEDPLARVLRERAVWHIVPNMNPDGSFRGHLRTNAAGANLNREWATPTAEHSPEVLHVRAAMDAAGVDFCLDVHGDEALPYNFVSGAEGIEGFSDRLRDLQAAFLDGYQRTSPDFQQVHGYPIDSPGGANLTMATNAVAHRFDCLSMTLEQPFKDNADLPDAGVGWSPGRAKRLGAAVLDPIADVVRMGLRGT